MIWMLALVDTPLVRMRPRREALQPLYFLDWRDGRMMTRSQRRSDDVGSVPLPTGPLNQK